MIGLKEYIDRHGLHFTEELAAEAIKSFGDDLWDASKVDAMLQKRVYYNTTGTTKGDIVYIANMARSILFQKEENLQKKCLEYIISVIQGVEGYDGIAFSSGAAGMEFKEEDFDLTIYL